MQCVYVLHTRTIEELFSKQMSDDVLSVQSSSKNTPICPKQPHTTETAAARLDIHLCVRSTLENTECKQWLKSKILIQCVQRFFVYPRLSLSRSLSVLIRLLVRIHLHSNSSQTLSYPIKL